MKLIVGLGNPGKEYLKTRHNIGFRVLDNMLGNVTWSSKFKALIYKKKIDSETIIFAKPLTFMNYSGIAVQQIIAYYQIDYSDVLVIQDDLDLPLGRYKLKTASSSGGHHGIQSIIDMLQTCKFARLKIGIGAAPTSDASSYVLDCFSQIEEEKLTQVLKMAESLIKCFIQKGLVTTMNIYNQK